jgi:hypothetical protein
LGIAVIVLLASLFWCIVRARSVESASSIALLAGTLAVIGAVTIGRAGFGVEVVSPRYITLVTPLVVAAIALMNDPAAGALRREVVLVLGVLALLSFPAADKLGHRIAKSMQSRLMAARADLLAGRPDGEVVVEHDLYPGLDYGVPRLEMLRRVRGSVFRDLPVPR